MSYYRVCEICGANLDPGERCSECYPAQEKRIRPGMVTITKGKLAHGPAPGATRGSRRKNMQGGFSFHPAHSSLGQWRP